MKWNIGCSGFSYKDWKNVFYPEKLPQNKWFSFYCSCFNTLELNVTFYRFPQVSTLQNWYDKSPDNFSFSVKAPRLITHYKQFNDTGDQLSGFYATCKEGLKNKLGPILFQFPATFTYTPERLHRIVNSLDTSFKNVLEFRDRAWWCDDVYELLTKNKIIFCGINHPSLPVDAIINNPVVYYRFHGVPKIYYSEYATEDLQIMADTVFNASVVKEVYCYFNNTATMAAINNALWLEKYCLPA